MREILFRGKRLYTNSDGNEGEWVNGHLASHDLIAEYEPYGVLPYHTETAYAGFVEVDPETVGQYTGLTDRNGKEIFEGDIVRSGELVYKVKYDTQKAAFVLSDYKEERTFCLSQQALDYYKIIGNIYDNPELMTRK